jgi:hypothetical protein
MRSLPYLLQAFSWVGIVCIGAGLFYIAKFNKKLLIFIMLWWTVPLGFYGNALTAAPRFFNIILPALIIPISVLLSRMLRHKKMIWKLDAALIFLFIVFVPLLDTYQTFIRRHHDALIPDYYRWVGQLTQSGATIITSDDALFITYYSGRGTLPRPVGIGHLPPKELDDFKNKLDNLLKNHKPVYITNLGFSLYDRYKEFGHLMRESYHLIQIGERPLEVWYITPFNPQLHISSLVKIEKKN